MVIATIVVPSTYVGNMMELSQERRGQFLNMQYEPGDRVIITYRMPLAEIIHDYYDQLKSRSKGYASLDYELVGFEEGNLVKLDVLVAGSPVDALSLIVDRSKAQHALGPIVAAFARTSRLTSARLPFTPSTSERPDSAGFT